MHFVLKLVFERVQVPEQLKQPHLHLPQEQDLGEPQEQNSATKLLSQKIWST